MPSDVQSNGTVTPEWGQGQWSNGWKLGALHRPKTSITICYADGEECAQPTAFAKAKVSDLTVRTMGGALFFKHEKTALWVPSLPERYFQSGCFEDQTSFQSGSFETQTSLNLAF